MKKSKLVWNKHDIKNIILVILGAFLTAVGLKFFVEAKALLPSGFTGLSWLIVRIFNEYLNIELSFSIIYFILNFIPAVFVYNHIGRKFTILSILHVVLVSVFTMFIPNVILTDDTLLVCIFGGLFAGAGSVSSLKAHASSGGTDFISIYFAKKLKKPIWNYILIFNATILVISGILFGIEPALYSIIYQFTNTQIINVFHDYYHLATLFIITKYPDKVSQTIIKKVQRGVTAIEAVGKYSESKLTILYLVVNVREANSIIRLVRSVDENVFISETKTNRVYGNFYYKPYE